MQMTVLTEKQIARIEKYWKQREMIEKKISQIRYYCIDELTDDGNDEWGRKATIDRYKMANKRIEAKKYELIERIADLDADYNKWLRDRVGLELNDNTQDEFTYNLINNGIKICT